MNLGEESSHVPLSIYSEVGSVYAQENTWNPSRQPPNPHKYVTLEALKWLVKEVEQEKPYVVLLTTNVRYFADLHASRSSSKCSEYINS